MEVVCHGSEPEKQCQHIQHKDNEGAPHPGRQ